MGIGSTDDTLFKSMNETSMSNNVVNSNLLNYNVCISTPPNILSHGIWGKHESEGSPFRSSFPVFLHQVILIYVTTRAINFPIKQLGLPKLISQMMVTIYIFTLTIIIIIIIIKFNIFFFFYITCNTSISLLQDSRIGKLA